MLDIIVIMCLYFGFFFQFLPMLIPKGDAVFDALHILPWGFIGVVWLAVGLGLVVYRGKKTKYWPLLDFPIPGTVIDLHVDKMNMTPQVLYKSRIEALLKTKKGDKYYRDHNGAALFSGGHEIRTSKDGINHMLDVNDLILTQKMKSMGINNSYEMDQYIKQQMLTMKKVGEDGRETDIYLLSGTKEQATGIDIENNAYHQAIYDELAKQYSITLVDGSCFSYYQHNDFQRSLASSTDMASAIDYVRSDEAAKAAKIKRGMGTGTWKVVVILGVILLVVVVLAFIFTGGGPPGLIPGQ